MKDGEGERHLKLKDYKLKEAEMRLEYLEKERQRLEEENVKKEREAAVSMQCLVLKETSIFFFIYLIRSCKAFTFMLVMREKHL